MQITKPPFQVSTHIMSMTNKNTWTAIYIFIVLLSISIVSVFGVEIFYRDKYYRQLSKGEAANSFSDIRTELNNKYNQTMSEKISKLSDFCTKLNNQPKTKEICTQYMEENKNFDEVLISDESNTAALASKINDSEKYFQYISKREIGKRISALGEIGTPYLFAILFIFIGFCGSSLGGLLEENSIFNSEKNVTRIANLIMGPICSLLVSLAMFYIFMPEDNENIIFAKRLFNLPISVYICSFIFSVTPMKSFENLVTFASNQLKSLVSK